MDFLDRLSDKWNITLFHYRNHAAAYGRVLMGIQAGKSDKKLKALLDEVGYYYEEESENPAYQMFLS